MGDTNIYVLATISIIINLLLVFGSGAFTYSLGWQSNLNDVQNDMNGIFGSSLENHTQNIPSNNLCMPDDESCDINEQGILGKVINTLTFDVFASIVNLGTYIPKAFVFIGMVLLGPFVIGFYILPKLYLVNPVVFWLTSLIVTLWEMAILYKLVTFILNRK